MVPVWALIVGSSPAWGGGYGVYDTRTLSLGGTGVALGDINSGHFYNPALTAFHDGHEDRTRDGLHSFQVVVANLSEGADTAIDALDDDLEDRLSAAIDTLNNVPTPETARLGIAAARDLESVMRDLKDEIVDGEASVNYSISLPADREGGAFFIGTRLVAEGISDIREADLELLQDYVEALQFIESGGTLGQDHLELRDGEGRFIDPSSQISSSATGTAALISEIGVSMAKEFTLWRQPVSFGAAPKAVYLRVFDDRWQTVNDEFDSSGEEESELYFNLDLGVAATVAEAFRVGLAVKDLRRQTLVTPEGHSVTLESRSRLGLAYLSEVWRVGFDLDLAKTANLRGDGARQDMALGVEYSLLDQLQLRAGYRHDLEDSVADQFTFGCGWRPGRLALDLAYSGGDNRGLGLHLGWAH